MQLPLTHTHTQTSVLRPFFWDHPGEPVPEENFWTLWCKGRLTAATTNKKDFARKSFCTSSTFS